MVTIVGHSLGGGMTAAAQAASADCQAVTFNGAGLNPDTVSRYLQGRQPQADATLVRARLSTCTGDLT